MNKFIIILILILSVGCTTTGTNHPLDESKIKGKYENLLKEGFKQLTAGNPKESIQNYFAPIIEAYNSYYGNSGKHVYCSRGPTETLFYMLKAAEKKEEAIAISQVWAQAFFYKGYANVELGDIDGAKSNIKKALELSPSNSIYLSELGYIYGTERKLNEALELYEQAEEFANTFSPEEIKTAEILKALHGSGYILIELGKLDEAEKKYRKCLEIDENDNKALNELKYIQNLRNQKNP